MDLQELIGENKNRVINLIIFAAILFVAFRIFNGQLKEVVSLKEKKATEQKKNEKLKEIEALQAKVKQYTDLVNNKDIANVLDTLNGLARESSIEIIAIRPSGEQSAALHTRYAFDLSIVGENYHAIAKFINKLENHDDIFSVDSASFSVISAEKEGVKYEKMGAALTVSTFLLK